MTGFSCIALIVHATGGSFFAFKTGLCYGSGSEHCVKIGFLSCMHLCFSLQVAMACAKLHMEQQRIQIPLGNRTVQDHSSDPKAQSMFNV